MSSLNQRNRTFGELITELRARLGFVAQGPSANSNRTVMESFLKEGHDYIYSELNPTTERKKASIMLAPGSYLYDWHNDIADENIDPGAVLSVWLAPTDTERYRLTQGISESDRANATPSQPTKYDTINGQCELYPVPDGNYALVIEYIAMQPEFSQDDHRPGVPDRLLFLYALAQAKAHYRHPDAQAAGATFNNMLRTAKSKRHENRRYIVNEARAPNRTVTGSDGEYRFMVD